MQTGRSSRVLITRTLTAALVITTLASQAVSQEPVQSPVKPRDTIANFVVHPQFSIELVACEPNVVDPVAVRFDEDGNMWVVEMRDYPHGPADGEPPASRIRILRDNDGDGLYETSHTFADNLLFATGIQPYKGSDGNDSKSVIVTLAGEVRWMSDTNGDFKADVNELWFSGFKQENPQLRANDPTMGPDGWIYVANGLRNGSVKAVKPEWKDQPVVELRRQDFRFHPRTGQFEAISGYGQFGMTFDDNGNRFVCSNRNPCNHVVLQQKYLDRNPFLVQTDPVEVVSPAAGDSRVFAISKPWTTSTLHAGQFTAACGVTMYRGDTFPGSFYGNSFTCEPTGNLVHRDVLIPDGPTFRSRYGRDGVEFLASRDNWFRPVNLANGPDGNLYVVDMYRAVIEHPQFMPAELKTRRDLRDGSDRGRIYRVVPKKRKEVTRPKPIDAANHDSVAAWRVSKNGWHRDIANRIARRSAKEESDSTDARIARTTRSGSLESMVFKSSDAYRLLLTLGDSKDLEKSLTYVAAITSAFPHPRHDQALLTYPPDATLPLLRAILKSRANASVVPHLCQQIALRNQEAEVVQALELALGAKDENAIGQLATGMRRKGRRLESLAKRLSEPANRDLRDMFANATRSLDSKDSLQQLKAIAILQHGPAKDVVPPLLNAATDSANMVDVQTAATAALDRHQSADVAARLLADFKAKTPKLQRAAVASCVTSASSAAVLIEYVLDGNIPATNLNAASQRTLRRYKDPELKKSVTKVLAALTPADRQAVLADYAACTTLESKPMRGRVVFEKNCATCHRVGELGVDIGPDIADSRTRTPEYLLTNILDPNRAVDSNYFGVTAVTEDGRIVTGVVTSETASSITLKQAEGKTVTLLRSDIDELKSDGISLMPVGLEKNISKQQMADLISFIKNWRYLDGDIPLSP